MKRTYPYLYNVDLPVATIPTTLSATTNEGDSKGKPLGVKQKSKAVVGGNSSGGSSVGVKRSAKLMIIDEEEEADFGGAISTVSASPSSSEAVTAATEIDLTSAVHLPDETTGVKVHEGDDSGKSNVSVSEVGVVPQNRVAESLQAITGQDKKKKRIQPVTIARLGETIPALPAKQSSESPEATENVARNEAESSLEDYEVVRHSSSLPHVVAIVPKDQNEDGIVQTSAMVVDIAGDQESTEPNCSSPPTSCRRPDASPDGSIIPTPEQQLTASIIASSSPGSGFSGVEPKPKKRISPIRLAPISPPNAEGTMQ